MYSVGLNVAVTVTRLLENKEPVTCTKCSKTWERGTQHHYGYNMPDGKGFILCEFCEYSMERGYDYDKCFRWRLAWK